MLIGITGDTHGSIQAMDKIAQKKLPVDLWLHTGDFYNDSFVLQELTGIKVESVLGNNDFNLPNALYDKLFALENHRILLTHGHRHGANLFYQAMEKNAEIVVSGHTHVPAITWQENIYFLNPGSPTYPRHGTAPSFILLELQKDSLPVAQLYTL